MRLYHVIHLVRGRWHLRLTLQLNALSLGLQIGGSADAFWPVGLGLGLVLIQARRTKP